MSIIFGTVLLTFAAGTTTWAAIGDRIAAIPGVARVLAYVDGGYNIPSDDKVDELVDYAKRRKAAGVADRDDIMPGTRITYLEHFESMCMRDAVSEAEIDEAPATTIATSTTMSGWRGWLAGGYAMPTDAQVDAAYPRTLRGLYRFPIERGWIFADEDPVAFRRSLEMLRQIDVELESLDTRGPVPMPDKFDEARAQLRTRYDLL